MEPSPSWKKEVLRLSDSIRADEVEPEEVTYLWRNHFPRGMPSLVAGMPGCGKSLLTALVTAEVTQRGESVIFSNMEDPIAQIVRPRLEAAGAVLERVHFWTPYLPRDMEELEEMIARTGASMLIIDPISAHLSVSIYNDQEVRQALSPISKLCAQTGVGMIAIHHTIKNTTRSTHPLSAVGGSGGGLPGAARAVYLFGLNPSDKDERALAPIKFNLGPAPKTLLFEMDSFDFILGEGENARMLESGRLLLTDPNSTLTAHTMIASAANGGGLTKSGKESKKLSAACEFITNYLGLGPRPVTDIREDAKQYAISWMTLRRAGEIVEVIAQRHGFGKGAHYTWELPQGHPGWRLDEIAALEDDEVQDQGGDGVD